MEKFFYRENQPKDGIKVHRVSLEAQANKALSSLTTPIQLRNTHNYEPTN